MIDVLETHIRKFEKGCKGLAAKGFRVDVLCEFGYLIAPAAGTLPLPATKSIGLTLMGITHGNEVVGVAVLNALLEVLRQPLFKLEIPLALVLGNPWAARQNRRFLDRDLNRSFARTQDDGLEERRANVLEDVLKQTAYLLDIHQTRERSERPFFIFPHTQASFALAQQIAPYLPIVTHWGDPFSEDGRCSDEFVNSCGGVGLTIELGQNGFDAYQISAGFAAVVQTIAAVQARLGAANDTGSLAPFKEAEIYTWSDVFPYPDGDVALEPGWYNFKHVQAGQRLGSIAGKPFVAAKAGWILFPQYPKPEDIKRPTELCRLMRKVDFTELPME